jgi:hypothetical protein
VKTENRKRGGSGGQTKKESEGEARINQRKRKEEKRKRGKRKGGKEVGEGRVGGIIKKDEYRDGILGHQFNKTLESFAPCYSQSLLLADYKETHTLPWY